MSSDYHIYLEYSRFILLADLTLQLSENDDQYIT